MGQADTICTSILPHGATKQRTMQSTQSIQSLRNRNKVLKIVKKGWQIFICQPFWLFLQYQIKT
jgi:hypothetical protein